MTANELADELERMIPALPLKALIKSATMLRQQQEKIDRLLDQYQQLNENLEMWKTGHFKQQAEIEELKTIRGNSVLVPSDKLQAMQAEIEALKVKAHKWYLIAMEKEQKKND